MIITARAVLKQWPAAARPPPTVTIQFTSAWRKSASPPGTAPVIYGTLQYNALLRLERISYHNGQTGGAFRVFSDYHYQRDGYGNIEGVNTKDRTKQIYGYNSAGEVASAKRLLTAQGST